MGGCLIMKFYTDQFTNERENWKEVKIFGIVQQRYMVSDTGKVYDKERGQFVQNDYDVKTGFTSVSLRTRSGRYRKFLMHRLVFEVFCPEEFKKAQEKKWLILHKDGNVRKNNLDNLEPAPASVVRQQRTHEISKLRR